MELAPGTLVGDRYQVLKPLGRGGVGWVYLARDTRFDSDIALKVAAAFDAGPPDGFAARVRREARIGYLLGKLPGIVRCLDWGKVPASDELFDAGGLFMVLELVEGARPLDLSTGAPAQVLQRLLTAASRVAVCHRRGVVHRDVKPQNFLVSADGTIYLSDFGSAKIVGAGPQAGDAGPERAKDPTLTEAGMLLGTPLFMSPEQFRDAADVDARADVFSLGVMLYHALVGEFPYVGRSPMEIMTNQVLIESGVTPPPRPPRQVSPTTSPALERLCLASIALSRDDRPADALEFTDRLAAAIGQARPGATRTATRPAPRRPTAEAFAAALRLDRTRFTAPERLRDSLLRLGPRRAQDLLAHALVLHVPDERPVNRATRYLGKVATLLAPDRGRLVVGRAAECDLTLDLVTVSKQHVAFEREADGWVVIDLGSSNGSAFNGGRLAPTLRQRMVDGDELRISDHVTLRMLGWRRLCELVGIDPGAAT